MCFTRQLGSGGKTAYSSCLSDLLCIRPSPSALHPSSLIRHIRRLQRATKRAVRGDFDESLFLSTVVGDQNELHTVAGGRRNVDLLECLE